MKIGTWNIERLKHISKLELITETIKEQNLDILVLTEDDSRLELKEFPYQIATFPTATLDEKYYKPTETRVRILSKYKISKRIDTYDNHTACCVSIITPIGELICYGTIMGVYGNRNKNFKEDLPKQIIDINTLSEQGNLCVLGDYNLSFSDSYYFTKAGRDMITKCFDLCNIKNITALKSETIDHIAISEQFMGTYSNSLTEWNTQKRLSDHKGIAIELYHN